jgi:hypothetical protein
MCYPKATHLVVVKGFKVATPNVHVGQPPIVSTILMGQHQLSPNNP